MSWTVLFCSVYFVLDEFRVEQHSKLIYLYTSKRSRSPRTSLCNIELSTLFVSSKDVLTHCTTKLVWLCSQALGQLSVVQFNEAGRMYTKTLNLSLSSRTRTAL